MALPDEVVQTFPEEIRQDPSWQKFDDVPAIAKSYVELQKMNGNSIRIPDEKAAPEDLQKWKGEHLPKLAARGIIDLPPGKPEEYKMPEIEGLKLDGELSASYIKEVAHATGMTQKQVEANLVFHHKMNQMAASALVSRDAADAEFKTALGNDYAPTMEKVTGALKAMSEDFPQFGAWAKTAYVINIGPDGKPGKAYPFDTHPMVRGMFEVMGDMSTEDNGRGGQMPNGVQSKEEIQAKITELRKELLIKSDPKKQEQLHELYRQLHPPQSAA